MVGLHLEFFRSVMVALWFVFLFSVLFFRHRFGACGVVRLGGQCMVSRTGALLFVCFSTSYFYHLSTTATAATTDIIITLHSIAL